MSSQAQAEIDALIEAVHARSPYAYDGEAQNAAIKRDCQAVLFRGVSILTVREMPDLRWSASQAELLDDELEPDRVEELSKGAEPTPEEQEVWQGQKDGMLFCAELAQAYRVTHSARPEMRAYVAWASTGSGQAADDTGWAGPSADVAALVPFLLEKAQRWHRVWTFDEGGDPSDESDENDRENGRQVMAAIVEVTGPPLVGDFEIVDEELE